MYTGYTLPVSEYDAYSNKKIEHKSIRVYTLFKIFIVNIISGATVFVLIL